MNRGPADGFREFVQSQRRKVGGTSGAESALDAPYSCRRAVVLWPALCVIIGRPVGFRGCRKGRLTQVSCVGAHRRAPYNPLTNIDLWAHVCAPLHASIKIKRSFTTPSLAHGPAGNREQQCLPNQGHLEPRHDGELPLDRRDQID